MFYLKRFVCFVVLGIFLFNGKAFALSYSYPHWSSKTFDSPDALCRAYTKSIFYPEYGFSNPGEAIIYGTAYLKEDYRENIAAVTEEMVPAERHFQCITEYQREDPFNGGFYDSVNYNPGTDQFHRMLITGDMCTPPEYWDNETQSCQSKYRLSAQDQSLKLEGEFCLGNPCNPVTGEKFDVEQDIATSSGLTFNRHYNSQAPHKTDKNFAFSWRHTYSRKINEDLNSFIEDPSGSDTTIKEADTITIGSVDRTSAYAADEHGDSYSKTYSSAEEACLNGWPEVSHLFWGGQPADSVEYREGSGLCKVTRGEDVVYLRVIRVGVGFGLPIGDIDREPLITKISRPNGRVYAFERIHGIWKSLNRPALVLEKIEGAVTGWRFTDADQTEEFYDAEGKLMAIVQANGLRQDLVYTLESGSGGDGNPETLDLVYDSFGQTLSFEYNDGLLSGVTSSAGRISYEHTNGNLTEVIRADGSVKQYHYENVDFPSHLTGITDERGHRYATWAYDKQGRAILSTYANNAEKVSIEYDDANDTRTITNSKGAETTYTVDNGAVTGINGPGCATCGVQGDLSFNYDAKGRLRAKTENGVTTRYGDFNDYNNPSFMKEAVGTSEERRTDYTYHPTFHNKVTSMREPSVLGGGARKVTDYTYDGFGNVTSITQSGYRPDGSAISRSLAFKYEGPFNQLSEIDGPRTDVSDIIRFEYYRNYIGVPENNRGRLFRIVDANGNVLRDDIQYSATGNVLSELRPNGVMLEYRYYAGNDRVESITQSAHTANGLQQQTVAFTYLPTGEVESITLGQGTADAVTITYGYDEARRLTQVIDPLGNQITYILDTEGNVTGMDVHDSTGELKRTQAAIYDEFSRLFKSVSAAGHVTEHYYTGAGDLEAVIDAKHQVTYSEYDALGRVNNMVDELNQNTLFQYDPQSNLVGVTDPKGNTTGYVYDDLGNLLTLNSPDTGVTEYEYDEAGNLTFQTDANGRSMYYQYDVLNRLIRITASDRTTTAYHYDQDENATGRLISIVRWSGRRWMSRVDYSYDAFGRITQKSQIERFNGTTRIFNTGYGYDAVGRLQSMTYPSGKTVSYQYAQGQLSGVNLDGQALVGDIQHAPFGGIEAWHWGEGSASSSREYDLDGQVASYQLGDASYGLTYDATGNIQIINNNTSENEDNRFQYDALDRLISYDHSSYDAHTPTMESNIGKFKYDANGNRTFNKRNGVDSNYYSVDSSSNRLWDIQGTLNRQYTYDDRGNILSDGEMYYRYDAQNRLIMAGVGFYIHNGLGQRVTKYSRLTGQNHYFVYDEAGQLIGEYDHQGNAIQEIVYLGNMPVSVITDTSTYQIHTDHLNTPRVITDGHNNVVWEWKNSDPFGANKANEDPDGNGIDFEFNLRFAGQYYDEESGLHYNYFRTYDPQTGRYTQSDPIGLNGGLNTYGYVAGNPLLYVDYYGLDLVVVGEGGHSGGMFTLAANTWVNNNPGSHQIVHATSGAEFITAMQNYAANNGGIIDGLQYFGHSSNYGLFINQGAGADSFYTDWWQHQCGCTYGSGSSTVPSVDASWFNSSSEVKFWGCNAGWNTGSIAQQFANQIRQPVEAATGPTVFSGVPGGLPGQGLPSIIPSSYSGGVYLVPQYPHQGFTVFSPISP